ncbi:MAG: hypothetical protein JW889_14470 [Verrucomicrobia bacterium]|nr:hypothetical protein [Verrucomicrobiota bacterium]
MVRGRRGWWDNCLVPDGDAEVAAIDALEDSIAPLDEQAKRIRRLITCLELCHHKAARRVELIIEAIGSGSTTKGPGTRPPGTRDPAEQVWQNSVAALSTWCAGCPADKIGLDVGGVPASELVRGIGERTPLKEWQVQRVVDKVREYVFWPRSYSDASFRYVGMQECGADYESIQVEECPERYREHAGFWDATMQTVIHDTVDGQPAEITLAVAVDHLQPCNWNFVRNLATVLRAIGGDLFPREPLALHARNIKRAPIREPMKVVSNTLRAFCGDAKAGEDMDGRILAVLRERTPVKHWLAASLDKTIRLHLEL